VPHWFGDEQCQRSKKRWSGSLHRVRNSCALLLNKPSELWVTKWKSLPGCRKLDFEVAEVGAVEELRSNLLVVEAEEVSWLKVRWHCPEDKNREKVG
jgi:hypothetical protein